MDADGNAISLIITTSPTPSAPATDLLSTVFQSYQAHCPELLSCPVIVVFDTYERIVSQLRLKKGEITPEGAEKYEAYKKNVKELVTRTFESQSLDQQQWTSREDEAEFGSPNTLPVPFVVTTASDSRVTFIEATERLGFGLAVRSALRAAQTPYVWVHQHDWELSTSIPLPSILDVMQRSVGDEVAPIRYVCLPSPRLLQYETSNHVERYPFLRTLTATLQRDAPSIKGPSVPLTPLFFWHDKPHIVERQHYLSRVFPSELALSRGAFIEDTVGHRARDQMKAGLWAKWACWLYAPADGKQICVRHLHGRVWKGEEGHKAQIEQWRAEGKRRARGPDVRPAAGLVAAAEIGKLDQHPSSRVLPGPE